MAHILPRRGAINPSRGARVQIPDWDGTAKHRSVIPPPTVPATGGVFFNSPDRFYEAALGVGVATGALLAVRGALSASPIGSELSSFRLQAAP